MFSTKKIYQQELNNRKLLHFMQHVYSLSENIYVQTKIIFLRRKHFVTSILNKAFTQFEEVKFINL